MTVTVKNDQTLADIAIQEYGTLDGLFLLAQANGLNPTDTLTAGQILSRPAAVLNKEMQAECHNASVSPATALNRKSPIRLRIFTEQFSEPFT